MIVNDDDDDDDEGMGRLTQRDSQGLKLGENSMGICYPILNAFGHIENPQTKK